MRVGVVGHRSLSARSRVTASAACARVIARLRAQAPELVAVSALAEGADTLFADAAVGLDVPLEVVRPHDLYREDFETPTARSEYDRLWSIARHRTLMPSPTPSDLAYRSAMEWIADSSDVLVAIWAGPDAIAGETARTVAYARARGTTLVHLDPETGEVVDA